MSGWIKVEKELETDPRVLRMAKAIDKKFLLFAWPHKDGLDPCNACALPGVTLVCGALARLWIYADSHIREDDTLDMGIAEIDEWLGIDGFCALMPSDWLSPIDEHCVELPGFQAHNGVEAKKRALTQKRVTQHRERVKRTGVTSCNASALPDQDQTKTRLDQKKEAPSELVAQKRDDGPAERIFAHWRAEYRHPKAVLDAKRRKVIQRSLEAYDEPTLCQAISGYKLSPHHMGQNDQRTVYDDLELFLRDASHIDRGLAFARAPPQAAKSAVELARERLRGSGNGRVVGEQSGSGDGGMGPALGLLRGGTSA
jgi:hypothetical protein